MLAAEDIKTIAIELGADQCGIASIDRFDDAPDGFHPCEVYSKCKSVVVFLKQMPPEVINAENPIPYSHTAYQLYDTLDNLCIHNQLYVKL